MLLFEILYTFIIIRALFFLFSINIIMNIFDKEERNKEDKNNVIIRD